MRTLPADLEHVRRKIVSVCGLEDAKKTKIDSLMQKIYGALVQYSHEWALGQDRPSNYRVSFEKLHCSCIQLTEALNLCDPVARSMLKKAGFLKVIPFRPEFVPDGAPDPKLPPPTPESLYESLDVDFVLLVAAVKHLTEASEKCANIAASRSSIGARPKGAERMLEKRLNGFFDVHNGWKADRSWSAAERKEAFRDRQKNKREFVTACMKLVDAKVRKAQRPKA